MEEESDSTMTSTVSLLGVILDILRPSQLERSIEMAKAATNVAAIALGVYVFINLP